MLAQRRIAALEQQLADAQAALTNERAEHEAVLAKLLDNQSGASQPEQHTLQAREQKLAEAQVVLSQERTELALAREALKADTSKMNIIWATLAPQI